MYLIIAAKTVDVHLNIAVYVENMLAYVYFII